MSDKSNLQQAIAEHRSRIAYYHAMYVMRLWGQDDLSRQIRTADLQNGLRAIRAHYEALKQSDPDSVGEMRDICYLFQIDLRPEVEVDFENIMKHVI